MLELDMIKIIRTQAVWRIKEIYDVLFIGSMIDTVKLEQNQKEINDIFGQWETLIIKSSNTKSNEEKLMNFKKLKEQYHALFEIINKIVLLNQNQNRSLAIAALKNLTKTQQENEIERLIENVITRQKKDFNLVQQEWEKTRKLLITISSYIIVTSILFIVFMGIFIYLSISSRLNKLKNAVARYSADETPGKISAAGKDEIKSLSHDITEMMKELANSRSEIINAKKNQEDKINLLLEGIMKISLGEYSMELPVSEKKDELDSLAMGINLMADDIKKTISELHTAEEKLKEYTSHIENDLQKKKKDLERAQKIQRSLQPADLPVIKDLNITAYYVPSEELGGDFINIRKIDNKLLIIIADCTGHGFEAAIDSTMLKAVTDKHLDILTRGAPDEFLAKINADIISYLSESRLFTMLAAVFDITARELVFSSANSEAFYLIENRQISRISNARSFHIGYDSETSFTKSRIKIGYGGMLFFCSDAFREIKKNENEVLGILGLEQIIEKFGNGVNADSRYFFREIKNINKLLPLEDDATLLLLESICEYRRHYSINTLEKLTEIQKELAKKMEYYSYSGDDRELLLISLEEMVINGIVHGNKENSSKELKIEIKMDCEYIQIEIEDQGQGFCLEDIPDPTDTDRLRQLLDNNNTELYTHGRGVFLVNMYMDQVTYNEKGNQVCIVKKKNFNKTAFEINNEV
ncbi:MAG: hypothetical protein A2096_00075 [Spirochaetes bacterium GWF1_41_5]|nr:MAG: hypothetical protein A2096_00075 [Spirochaetes bacterium GWF1_41_5]